MAITLLNSGLQCPEVGENPVQACEMIKELYRAFDIVYAQVNSGGGGTGTTPTDANVVQNIPSTNWLLVDADCKIYTQTITLPSGIDAFKSSYIIRDASGEIVNLCTTIIGSTTIEIETCEPGNYTIVYA